jgi:hypothetical protein
MEDEAHGWLIDGIQLSFLDRLRLLLGRKIAIRLINRRWETNISLFVERGDSYHVTETLSRVSVDFPNSHPAASVSHREAAGVH